MRIFIPTLALFSAMACETPEQPEVQGGCDAHLETRVEHAEGRLEVEVWLTAHETDKVFRIPECMGITANGTWIEPCDANGELDDSACESGSFEMRGNTSLQLALFSVPTAGDVCNEPLESGPVEIRAIGLDSMGFRVCDDPAVVVVP